MRLTKALQFRQQGHPEFEVLHFYNKSLVAKYDGVVDSHATSNLCRIKHYTGISHYQKKIEADKMR